MLSLCYFGRFFNQATSNVEKSNGVNGFVRHECGQLLGDLQRDKNTSSNGKNSGPV